MESFVHPTAIVEEPVQIGPGTKIWHFSHIMAGADIGAGCVLGQNVFVASTARIGDRVKIQNNVSLYDGVELEADVFCGPSVVFTNVINPRSFIPRKQEFKKTWIGRGVTLGANATILCGIAIGCYALIGAGSVVTKDVPCYAMAYGNPARLTGWVCQCGMKLKKQGQGWMCPTCKASYAFDQQGLMTPVGNAKSQL
jgi:UDP-2-acetamido-3-amino-2,3-dideoxy-glucuronate N-acetyltransferase